MRRPGRLLPPGLLCAAAALVSGSGLRRLRTPPVVNPRLDALEGERADAKVTALKAKAVAAASRAAWSASRASTSELRLEKLYLQAKAMRPELDNMLLTAQYAAQAAGRASNTTLDALTATKKFAATAVEDAKQLAVVEVQKVLAGQDQKLEAWRDRVLSNPHDKAVAAGAQAAEPYYKMVNTFYDRIHSNQAAAWAMMTKARRAATDAQSIAAAAQVRMEGGDTIGASSDYEVAKAMQTQSAELARSAQSLQATAEWGNKMIPEYLSAAQRAGWSAQYQANPDGVPPPPVNPNYAFTPPPLG